MNYFMSDPRVPDFTTMHVPARHIIQVRLPREASWEDLECAGRMVRAMADAFGAEVPILLLYAGEQVEAVGFDSLTDEQLRAAGLKRLASLGGVHDSVPIFDSALASETTPVLAIDREVALEPPGVETRFHIPPSPFHVDSADAQRWLTDRAIPSTVVEVLGFPQYFHVTTPQASRALHDALCDAFVGCSFDVRSDEVVS